MKWTLKQESLLLNKLLTTKGDIMQQYNINIIFYGDETGLWEGKIGRGLKLWNLGIQKNEEKIKAIVISEKVGC